MRKGPHGTEEPFERRGQESHRATLEEMPTCHAMHRRCSSSCIGVQQGRRKRPIRI